MRIGIISHNYPKNTKDRKDAGIFVYDFAEELAKGNEVSVFSPSTKNFENYVGNTKVYWHKWMGGKKLGKFKFYNPVDYVRYSASFVAAFLRLINFANRANPDYILAMWVFPAGLFALFMKVFFNKKYSIWALGSDIYVYAKYPFIGFLFLFIIKNADFIFSDGYDLCKKIKEISGRSSIFLPSSSDFKLSKVKRIKSRKIVITFLGRLEKVKGPDIFVEALISLHNDKNFTFNIIGDGSLKNDLEREVYDSGLSSVKFLGNISESGKIASILVNSDWLVIPSRSDSIPLVFSEAAKCHLPMIVSDLPDFKQLIKNYKVGYVFKTGDYKDLLRILKELPKRSKDRISFVKRTKKVSEDFNIKNSANKFMKYISK